MAASTVYSALYDSNNQPVNGRPRRSPMGADWDYVNEEIATTSLDEANDRKFMIPVPSGKTVGKLEITNEDLDSGGGNLDLDIVGVTEDKDGNLTETILYNAGTAFNAAVTTPKVIYPNWTVPASAKGYGHIATKVNVAASTAAAGDIGIFALWR